MTHYEAIVEALEKEIIRNYFETDEQDICPRACRELDDMIDADSELGLTEIDNPKSHYYTPQVVRYQEADEFGYPITIVEELDGCSENVNQYWCSCSNPVIESEATQNDRRQRNLEEVLPPNKTFYSVAKPFNTKEYKRKHRNYMLWMAWIFKNQNDTTKLQNGWKTFWRNWNHPTKGGFRWMDAKHMQLIRKAFNRFGISKR